MSDITEHTGLRAGATTVVHESYAFACMRCGHGWEQSYEIEHHTDADGHDYVIYVTDGHVVPSPLRRPVCQNCDHHVVRIMRAGQVASVRAAARGTTRLVPPAGPVEVPAVPSEAPEPRVSPEPSGPAAPAAAGNADGHHHWHLSDLLHPFQRRAS
ncbi:hypothetical protein MTQ10_07525 [Streptomyces sp. XM83C]|uniref:hypothetical protein n=1 Tax=Streptomyces sp. XM83C TaxID=2929781 RepID=UPI001FF7A2C6|nr:hypothetical protein [Streptomyces sp. XM83C]MCK1819461.1 hypothetical protein [Streptomyces sp. XM83C]